MQTEAKGIKRSSRGGKRRPPEEARGEAKWQEDQRHEGLPQKEEKKEDTLIKYYSSIILMECDVKSIMCSGYYVTP